MRKPLLTALAATVMLCVSIPALAHDQGRGRHDGTRQYQQDQAQRFINPFLALFCDGRDCRLKSQRPHRVRHWHKHHRRYHAHRHARHHHRHEHPHYWGRHKWHDHGKYRQRHRHWRHFGG